MAGQKIRIRLKSYDHEVIDQSAKKIDIVDPTPKAVDSLMHIDLPADVNIEIKL